MEWEKVAAVVKGAIEKESGPSWEREVARRADLGQYEELLTELDLATYIQKGTGDKIRRTMGVLWVPDLFTLTVST